MKYTTNQVDFFAAGGAWDKLSDGCKNEVTEIDGVAYYCLKNGNGKVVKPKGFPRVDLSEF